MSLPTAGEMDAWLTGYAACLAKLLYYYPLRVATDTLYLEAVEWIRKNADDPGLYQLRELEIRWGRDRTAEGKRATLRDILAARDAVMVTP